MSHGLTLRTHCAAFGTQMAIGIDLHLHAAVAEDSFRDNCDHIDPFHLRRDNEGCRFVIGVSRARANGGDKCLGVADQRSVPILAALDKWHDGFATLNSAIQHDVRVQAHQLAVFVAVAIARSSAPGLDVAKHRTGIATDCIVSHARLRWPWRGWPLAPDPESPE